MFNKKKKSYTLTDIEKLFTFIPSIFILILAILLIIISFFILDFKQKRDVDLIQQKQILNYEFEKKDQLYDFSNEVEKKVNKELSYVKASLREIIFKTKGYLDAKLNNQLSLDELIGYINAFEKEEGVKFVLFDKEELNISYGKEMILHLQQVMFNHTNNDKFQKLTLQYISSQGTNNLQYWKYDLQKNLILSFFDKVEINQKEYFIGVFSSINNIKQLTKEIIINSIKQIKPQVDYDIWFYDSNTRNTFNFNKQHEFINSENILKSTNKKVKKYELLNYYTKNDDENRAYSKHVYLYSKYAYFIGIDYDYSSHVLKQNDAKVNEIIKEYRSLLFKILSFIIMLTAVLILFSYVFSNFIKSIFGKYNKELQLKTDSLEHWKKRFELAIIASNDGLWDIDFKADKIYFSQKWLSMFGYEKGELNCFSDWFNLIHKEDKQEVQMKFDKIFAGVDDSFMGEYRLKTKENGYKWVFARGKIFKEEQSDSKRMLMMSMDIDKNKKMIKELSDVELLVEDGRIVICKLVNDEKLSVKYVSNSIKTFGYSKKEFEAQNIYFMDIIVKEDQDELKAAINAALSKELKSFSKVFRITNTGGQIRWMFLRAILLKDDFGNVNEFYCYVHDITKIKVSEEELKIKVKDEVNKNRKKDRLLIQQSKLASMGEMLGNIAHQWRQPLNTVNLILHFLRDNYQNENFTKDKLEKYINKSKTQIDYMSQTIDDFRKFYKPSKTPNEFNITTAIKDVLKISKEQFEHDEITVDLQSQDVIITNYENELKQGLLNILNNAKDAIIKKREKEEYNAFVKIKVSKKQNVVKVIIHNNGEQIDADIIDRIFEPYFTTKFETQGTGIGLYMTKTIIETNMKGKIKVANCKNGVKFKITLPLKTILK